MAPRVGLEPTTYRLTAGCSTFELLRNNNWLWPTLPRPFGLSTISDEELNFCVRYGNRCILFSIITILFFSYFKLRPSSLDFVSILSHILIYAPSYFTRLPRITRLKCDDILLIWYIGFIGGDKEIRTPDPLLARQVLSQLSYAPIFSYFKLRPSSLDFVSILSHIFIYAPSYFTRLLRINRFKYKNILWYLA